MGLTMNLTTSVYGVFITLCSIWMAYHLMLNWKKAYSHTHDQHKKSCITMGALFIVGLIIFGVILFWKKVLIDGNL